MDIYRELLGSLGAIVLDIDPRALSSRRWIETIHPDDRNAVVDACMRAAERREAGRVEFRASTDGISTRWIDLTLQPLCDSAGGCRLTGAMVDVTAQHELGDREACYRAMVSNCADAIALLERDGRIRFVTESVEHISGHSAAD